MQYLLSPSVTFSGLGSVPFRDDFMRENNLIQGTERGILYDDGFLTQDYIETILVEGSTAVQLVPSPNTDATSAFLITGPQQLPDNDPNAVLFHRYASVAAADREFKAEYSGSLNWEINYTRFLSANRRLGMQVGFGVSGFDSTFRDSVDADLYIQQFRHEIVQGERPELPNPTEDGTQAPVLGQRTRADVNSGNLLEWAASDESQEMVLDGATVDSLADLRSSMYSFKAGPVYHAQLFRRVAVQVGVGVSALYYSGSFAAYEVLNNPTGGENPSRGLTTTDQTEWQVGGYLDANARYRINQRVDFFSGVQVLSGSTYTQRNEEREVNVDFSSQVYIHAGFGIRF